MENLILFLINYVGPSLVEHERFFEDTSDKIVPVVMGISLIALLFGLTKRMLKRRTNILPAEKKLWRRTDINRVLIILIIIILFILSSIFGGLINKNMKNQNALLSDISKRISKIDTLILSVDSIKSDLKKQALKLDTISNNQDSINSKIDDLTLLVNKQNLILSKHTNEIENLKNGISYLADEFDSLEKRIGDIQFEKDTSDCSIDSIKFKIEEKFADSTITRFSKTESLEDLKNGKEYELPEKDFSGIRNVAEKVTAKKDTYNEIQLLLGLGGLTTSIAISQKETTYYRDINLNVDGTLISQRIPVLTEKRTRPIAYIMGGAATVLVTQAILERTGVLNFNLLEEIGAQINLLSRLETLKISIPIGKNINKHKNK